MKNPIIIITVIPKSAMATPYYRALATAHHLSQELKTETDRRKAMELCFKKAHASLNMYKGRCINRVRFHLNRHHTEYLRKVRAAEASSSSSLSSQQKKQQPKNPTPDRKPTNSLRVGIASDMAAQIRRLEQMVQDRDAEIERLCALLDHAVKRLE